MKRIVVIILVILLIAGGGAGGLMMMGVIPNPFNPAPLGPALTGAEKVAAESSRKFQPPRTAYNLIKIDDMIVPVIMEGKVGRRVFIIARLVVDAPVNEEKVELRVRAYQDAVLRDLVPFFQIYFRDHDAVNAEVVKARLVAAAKRVYGETVPDVLLINVFEQVNSNARR